MISEFLQSVFQSNPARADFCAVILKDLKFAERLLACCFDLLSLVNNDVKVSGDSNWQQDVGRANHPSCYSHPESRSFFANNCTFIRLFYILFYHSILCYSLFILKYFMVLCIIYKYLLCVFFLLRTHIVCIGIIPCGGGRVAATCARQLRCNRTNSTMAHAVTHQGYKAS